VGTLREAIALQVVAMKFSTAQHMFVQAQARLPTLESPQELAVFLAAQACPTLPVTPALFRLIGWYPGQAADTSDD
jgi:hypothetical protein